LANFLILSSAEPAAATATTVKSKTNNSITVQWGAPATGVYDKFLVGIQDQGSLKEISKNTFETTFDGLSAGTDFSVEVITVSYDQQGAASTAVLSTCEIFYNLITGTHKIVY
jgi:hypothetical protein